MSRFNKISLIIWILINLTALGGLFFLIFSTLRSDLRLEEKNNQIKIMTQQEEEVNILERLAKETADDRLLINSFFVDSRDVTDFLDSLENLGEKTGTELETQSIIAFAGPPATLKVSFKGKGSFRGLYRLVEFLEQAPYELKINKILLSKNEDKTTEEGDSLDWNGSFEVELFSFIYN